MLLTKNIKTMKFKKLFSISLIATSLFIVFSCSSSKCENSKEEYREGYGYGKTSVMLGGQSCKSYVDSYNKGLGRKGLEATDCFCAGFNDGAKGKPKKY